jgi:glycosyltransferase involved in cell wall biosynthesis
MKVVLYTIAKNEEAFCERFYNSAKEADEVIVADTGSTDGTVEKLRALGATVHEIKVDPWRFDDARNASLNFVPADTDICISIDLDEVLTPGWRAALEKSWTPETTRLRYQYWWSVNPDGTAGVSFWYDKVHSREGYRWVNPVHEVLAIYGRPEVQTYCNDFTLKHFPDSTKSRGSYLPLLELSTKEDPENDRNSHYLGREYMFYGKFDQGIAELKRHLSLKSATWPAERAASMRFIARCYNSKGESDEAIRWNLRAAAESIGDREAWVELARLYYARQDWQGVLFAADKALAIKERPASYICEPFAWGFEPHDLKALAAYNLGLKKVALEQGELALSFAPNDERLKNNVNFYKADLE